MSSELVALWNTVVLTRRVVADQRNLPRSAASRVAGEDLLSALEAYVDELTELGRPLPPALRDELRRLRIASIYLPHRRRAPL